MVLTYSEEHTMHDCACSFSCCSDEGTTQEGTDSCHSSIHLTVSVHIDCGGCRLACTHTDTHQWTILKQGGGCPSD